MDEMTANVTTSRAARMQQLLRAAFAPTHLELRDESHLHVGHAHKDEQGESETHFRLTIASDFFGGLSRIERQRLVNNALATEFATGLHALTLKIVD